jgi:hypothetical protein
MGWRILLLVADCWLLVADCWVLGPGIAKGWP